MKKAVNLLDKVLVLHFALSKYSWYNNKINQIKVFGLSLLYFISLICFLI